MFSKAALYRSLYILCALLSAFVCSGLARADCKNYVPPPMAPLVCDNFVITALDGNNKDHSDTGYYVHFTNSNGFKPYNMDGTQGQCQNSHYGLGTLGVRGKHVLLEISPMGATLGPDDPSADRAKIRVEMGPNFQFEDGSRTVTVDMPRAGTFKKYLDVVPSADCSAAIEAWKRWNSNPAASQQPVPPNPTGPSAAILWVDKNNQDITNKDQTIIAGMATTVRGECAPRSDGTHTRFIWSIPQDLTGGFEVSDGKGGLRTINGKQSTITVYGAFGGTHPKLALTCVDANSRSSLATTTFDVSGPVLNQGGRQLPPDQKPAIAISTFASKVTITRRTLQDPDGKTNVYMPVLAPASIIKAEPVPRAVLFTALENLLPANGDFEWVQLIKNYPIKGKLLNGRREACFAPPGLDTGYPLGLGPEIRDDPYVSLNSSRYLEQDIEFSATTYLMWRTNKEATYVPVAVINWGFKAAAVQDNDPLRIDRYPVAKNGYLDLKPLGWSIVPGSAATFIDSPRTATGLGDFPQWTTVWKKELVRCTPVP